MCVLQLSLLRNLFVHHPGSEVDRKEAGGQNLQKVPRTLWRRFDTKALRDWLVAEDTQRPERGCPRGVLHAADITLQAGLRRCRPRQPGRRQRPVRADQGFRRTEHLGQDRVPDCHTYLRFKGRIGPCPRSVLPSKIGVKSIKKKNYEQSEENKHKKVREKWNEENKTWE